MVIPFSLNLGLGGIKKETTDTRY